jgi:hypothetical protein
MAKAPIKVMMSSSVFGMLSLLHQVSAALQSFGGYDIICSPTRNPYAATSHPKTISKMRSGAIRTLGASAQLNTRPPSANAF